MVSNLRKIEWHEFRGLVHITAYMDSDGKCIDWCAEGWNGHDLSHRFDDAEVRADAEDKYIERVSHEKQA